MKKIRNVILAFLCIFAVAVMPAMAAEDDENEKSESVIEWSEWINPKEGIDAVEESPAGNPLKDFLNLVFGGVIIYGAISIGKSWIKSNSDDGEKASDGFMGMGRKTVGALGLIFCLAMYFYLLGYKI